MGKLCFISPDYIQAPFLHFSSFMPFEIYYLLITNGKLLCGGR
jgi:hypothetical protein